jgi:hypothetical protein
LGVLFVDRVIDTAVAERAHMRAEAVHSYTEEARAGLNRLLERLAVVTNPDVSTQELLEDDGRFHEVEEFLAEASTHGGAIIGRGANFVLRDVPGVLSVLLVGPRDAQIQQAMRLHGPGSAIN